MPRFTVEMHGDVRELYEVEADTADEAAENWASGDLYLSETMGVEVYMVIENEDDDA
jgi:hypothetical protein